jgi:hypothetical protein
MGSQLQQDVCAGATTQRAAIRWRLVVFASMCVVPAAAAYGNTASQLMFARIAHVMWMNLIVSCVEACVVCMIFKTRWLLTIILLVVANYASGFVGVVFFGGASGEEPFFVIMEQFLHPIHQMSQLAAVALAVCFVASFLTEWPCFHLALPRGQRTFRRSALATLVGHAVSYTCCASWAMGFNLPRGSHVDTSLSFAPVSRTVGCITSPTNATRSGASVRTVMASRSFSRLMNAAAPSAPIRVRTERDGISFGGERTSGTRQSHLS